MPDLDEFMKTIKRAALDAVKASKPAEICFGKVTSASPLKILVEQKLPLGEGQLILTRNVTDFVTEVTVDWATEDKGGGSGNAGRSVLKKSGGKGSGKSCRTEAGQIGRWNCQKARRSSERKIKGDVKKEKETKTGSI